MANPDSIMDEIDSIVLHHVETIDKVFDDLKKAVTTTAAAAESEIESVSTTASPNFLRERIDSAQQR